MTSLFGEGSFQGPVSTAVLNSIQASVQSRKFNSLKSHLGKAMSTAKKINLILKNLNKTGKYFKKDKELYEKYKTAVYAIRQVLYFVAVIYQNRKIINRKVFEGLGNLVHENLNYYVDESLSDVLVLRT